MSLGLRAWPGAGGVLGGAPGPIDLEAAAGTRKNPKAREYAARLKDVVQERRQTHDVVASDVAASDVTEARQSRVLADQYAATALKQLNAGTSSQEVMSAVGVCSARRL